MERRAWCPYSQNLICKKLYMHTMGTKPNNNKKIQPLHVTASLIDKNNKNLVNCYPVLVQQLAQFLHFDELTTTFDPGTVIFARLGN